MKDQQGHPAPQPLQHRPLVPHQSPYGHARVPQIGRAVRKQLAHDEGVVRVRAMFSSVTVMVLPATLSTTAT